MQNQITKNWQELKFGDVATLHRGYDLPVEKMIVGDHPVIFSNGKIEYHNQYKIKGPGVVTGRSGSLGNTFYINQDYWPHNTTLYVSNFHGNNPKFVYYLLKTLNFSFLNAGSGVPTLNRNHVHEIPLKIPTNSEIQKQIAAVLSAFDDKIEINNKIAKTLEQMAQALFKEWFVHFRFPGYEKAEFVDNELGTIPKGWKLSRFEEYARLEYGKALQEEKRIPGNVLVYGSSGQVGTHTEKLCEGPGIVVGRKGNVGSVFWINEDFYPIDTTFYLSTKNSLYYIYFILKNMKFHTGDSAVPGLNRDSVHSQEIVIPDEMIIGQFNLIIKPIFEKLNKLQGENQKLAVLRNLLLPKLMRGEIRV